MTMNFEALIQKKETALSPLLTLMEECRLQFVKESTAFAFEWYQKTAKLYITKYPEIILSMKEEKMAKMKVQVNDLMRSAERIVNTEFSSPDLWWHKNPRLHDSVEQYTQVADKYPEILDKAVRRVLGHLGTILEEHGFNVATSGNTGSYPEFWFEVPQGGGSTTPVPFYPHLLAWSKEMESTIKKYNTIYTQALMVFGEIQRLKEQKKAQRASERWDST
jgi:hypothetical protein